jgi:hypothetical protein
MFIYIAGAQIPIESFAAFLAAINHYLMINGIKSPYHREILETKMQTEGRASFLNILAKIGPHGANLSTGINKVFHLINEVNGNENLKSMLACWTLATLVCSTIDVLNKKGQSLGAFTPDQVNTAYGESLNIDTTISEIQ